MEAQTETGPVQAPKGVWGSAGAVPQPWGKVATPEAHSLQDVMSEELAIQMENETADKVTSNEDIDLSAFMTEDEREATSNDMLMAQMLQHEFDKEHDLILKKEEDKWNGSSKVTLSFKNYRSIHPTTQAEEDDEEEDEPEEMDTRPRAQGPKFNRGGVSGKGKNMISKHDANISGRKNAAKVEDLFPPEFELGDTSKVKDMRLPNHVYNKLKSHSQHESKRSQRIHEKKEHATSDMVVDPKTRLILYKLVNGGVLDTINGVVSSGKESVVYHGEGGTLNGALVPAEVAIKVFKTTLAEFKNRCQYVNGDVRFFKDQFKKQNPRKIIRVWSEKEEINLKRMERCGIPCPKSVMLKKHVLLMEFIGENQVAAPKLKDAELNTAQLQVAYEQVVENMKKMYHDAKLVHADLSEYNMLWHREQVYFIDVAQAVDAMHPFATEFLLRDCHNVSKFFSKNGVHGVLSQYDLFNAVTGMELDGEGEEFLSQVEDYEKTADLLKQATSRTEYPFDYFFDLAQKKQAAATADSVNATQQLAEDSDTDSEESEGSDHGLDPEHWVIVPPSECEGKEERPPSEKSRNDARAKDEGDDAGFVEVEKSELQK